MYKWTAIILFLGLLPAWGQTSAMDPSLQVPNVVAEPVSSVDLLRQANKDNSPLAAPSSKKPPRIPRASRSKKVSTSTATAPAARTLDMPLMVGGSTATVQTVVAPTPKPKAPKTVSSKTAQVTTQPSTPDIVEKPMENTEEEDAADAELDPASPISVI